MILRRSLILQVFSNLAHTIIIIPEGEKFLRRKTAYRRRKSERFHGQD